MLDVPGITSFITTTIVNFEPVFANYDLMAVAINTLAECSRRYPVQIHGFVIMPNHMHLLATGENQRLVSRFIGILKEYSAKKVIKWCNENSGEHLLAVFAAAADASKQGHHYQVWQKRFHNVAIANQQDFLIKLNYIHTNPVQERWGLCDVPEEYPNSSARYYANDEDVGVPIVNRDSFARSPVDG